MCEAGPREFHGCGCRKLVVSVCHDKRKENMKRDAEREKATVIKK
jgi:hypothetical protein